MRNPERRLQSEANPSGIRSCRKSSDGIAICSAARDNSLIFAESRSPYVQRAERHPMPTRMQATGEDKRTAEDRPTCDYLETTRTFWQPYAERELSPKMPARWRTTSLAFSPCCASGHSESGSAENAESLGDLRHLYRGSVEDCARVLRQDIKCNLDAELICPLAPGLIQYAIVARGRT
jgi:hypothetical protein